MQIYYVLQQKTLQKHLHERHHYRVLLRVKDLEISEYDHQYYEPQEHTHQELEVSAIKVSDKVQE